MGATSMKPPNRLFRSRPARDFYYWIAINGASVAASQVALPETLTVIPRPNYLVGFPTREEQLEAQEFALTAPIPDVYQRTVEWAYRADVKYIVLKNPDPPTHGQTAWIVGQQPKDN
jgi:hypothetical protein